METKKYFLLTFNPEKWIKNQPDKGQDWMTEEVDLFRQSPNAYTPWWSIHAYKQVEVGDVCFLHQQGKGLRGIFGAGYVIDGPKEMQDRLHPEKKSWYVKLCVCYMSDPAKLVLIKSSFLKQNFPDVHWGTQVGGIEIKNHEAALFIIDTLAYDERHDYNKAFVKKFPEYKKCLKELNELFHIGCDEFFYPCNENTIHKKIELLQKDPYLKELDNKTILIEMLSAYKRYVNEEWHGRMEDIMD